MTRLDAAVYLRAEIYKRDGGSTRMSRMESKADEPTREQLAATLTKTTHGGSIVSTAALSQTEIAAARCCGRLIVIDGGFGFVYLPPKEEAP